jgi:hypothetical protein
MSKAKFNANDVDMAMAEFLANAAATETPGLGYNGDITVYKENGNGQSKGPIDGYLENVQSGLDSE